jgi:hypothetical protein
MRDRKVLGVVLFAAVAGLAFAAPARAEVQITIHDGRVSLVAKDATLGQILTEWAKVGQTTIVNSERVPGGPLTLQLTDVPEAQALDILLRGLSGYVAAPRATPLAGLSLFDRIVVMPTVAAPGSGASTSTARSRFPQPAYSGVGPPEQDAPPVAFARENYPAADEVNWNPDPESVQQPLHVPFVREDFPADDEVNWNPQLANGGVPGPSSTPATRPSGGSSLVLPPGGAAASDNPDLPTDPVGVASPGMPTPAAVPH